MRFHPKRVQLPLVYSVCVNRDSHKLAAKLIDATGVESVHKMRETSNKKLGEY